MDLLFVGSSALHDDILAVTTSGARRLVRVVLLAIVCVSLGAAVVT